MDRLTNKFLRLDSSMVGAWTVLCCGCVVVLMIALIVAGCAGLVFLLWRHALGASFLLLGGA